jgi:tRNA threonylcarbamoyladenosine biosynthesis protein TsaE
MQIVILRKCGDINMLNIVTKNYSETLKLGELLSEYLTNIDVVVLSGELGAGKTVLVKGIVKGYSGKEEFVRSPSYIYINTYTGEKTVYHIDFYLLNDYAEALDTGFEEYLENDLCLIEWGDKFDELKDKKFWNIEIKYIDANSRDITIIPPKGKEHTLKEIEKKWPY